VAAIDGTILILRIIDLPSIQFRSSAASQSHRPTPSRSIRGTGRRSLEDFARSFFGINDASTTRRRSMGCGKVRVFHLEHYDGLRYPHLERDPAVPPRLDDILVARITERESTGLFKIL
jgi:hypothetical protein